MADSPVLERVRALVAPIASDLQLEVYDIEQRGGTLRVTLDTGPGADHGVDLEQLALATRLISRELDHHDPVAGRYTLEVSSPGIERALRRPQHFARALGARVSVRLVAPDASGRRRFDGTLTGSTDTTITVVTDGGPADLPIAQIDRAKTVFDWTPAPKPGKQSKRAGSTRAAGSEQAATEHDEPEHNEPDDDAREHDGPDDEDLRDDDLLDGFDDELDDFDDGFDDDMIDDDIEEDTP